MTVGAPNYSPQYSREEVLALGFAEVGENVLIDRTCRFYGAGNIHVGSHVRIDAYSVLSAGAGGIVLGSFIHFSTSVAILGAGKITFEDFSGLSAHVCIFSSNDDYATGAMTNPMVPMEYRNVSDAPVTLRRHAVVGAGSIVLPGVEIGIGASVGAMTLVRKVVPEFAIIFGNPARQIGERGRTMLEYEDKVRAAFLR